MIGYLEFLVKRIKSTAKILMQKAKSLKTQIRTHNTGYCTGVLI